MHINPLIEKEIRHNASNVRYGFRWCNVAMADQDPCTTSYFARFLCYAQILILEILNVCLV